MTEQQTRAADEALAEAEKQGAPVAEVEVWTEGVLTGDYVPMDREAVQHGAYRLLCDTIAYLDRAGRSDLVEKAIRDREERRHSATRLAR